ncbi:MAG: hypothetical protein ACR2OZ_11210 [Verrucomicrobiales bacterium]
MPALFSHSLPDQVVALRLPAIISTGDIPRVNNDPASPQPQRLRNVVILGVLAALFYLIGWRVSAWVLAAFAIVYFASWKSAARTRR